MPDPAPGPAAPWLRPMVLFRPWRSSTTELPLISAIRSSPRVSPRSKTRPSITARKSPVTVLRKVPVSRSSGSGPPAGGASGAGGNSRWNSPRAISSISSGLRNGSRPSPPATAASGGRAARAGPPPGRRARRLSRRGPTGSRHPPARERDDCLERLPGHRRSLVPEEIHPVPGAEADPHRRHHRQDDPLGMHRGLSSG